MDIATVFEWFAEESKSIAEQETEPAQREKFAKLASPWANATAESYFCLVDGCSKSLGSCSLEAEFRAVPGRPVVAERGSACSGD